MLIGNKKSCIFEIVVPKLDGFVFLLALTYFFVGRMKVHWYKVFYRGVSTHSFVVKNAICTQQQCSFQSRSFFPTALHGTSAALRCSGDMPPSLDCCKAKERAFGLTTVVKVHLA